MPAQVAPTRRFRTRSSVGGAGARDGGEALLVKSERQKVGRACPGAVVAAFDGYVPEGASAGGGDEGITPAARGGGGVTGGKRRVNSRSSTASTSSVES
jgi:hypothetical protein